VKNHAEEEERGEEGGEERGKEVAFNQRSFPLSPSFLYSVGLRF
jgi:hypothetical protein